MKRRIMRAIIALTLVIAMSAGMFASAWNSNNKPSGFQLVWDGRAALKENNASNKATFYLYRNVNAPGEISNITPLQQSGLPVPTSIFKDEVQFQFDKDHADMNDHWFYVRGENVKVNNGDNPFGFFLKENPEHAKFMLRQ